MRLFNKKKNKIKSEIIIDYDNCQSQSGKACFSDQIMYFEKIEVKGNNFIIHTSDNGLTKFGRLGGIYSLDDYAIIFKK